MIYKNLFQVPPYSSDLRKQLLPEYQRDLPFALLVLCSVVIFTYASIALIIRVLWELCGDVLYPSLNEAVMDITELAKLELFDNKEQI